MLTPYSLLSPQDKTNLINFINEYAPADIDESTLPNVLSHWNTSKQSLLDTLFHDSLILKFPISFTRPTEDIVNEISQNPTYQSLSNALYNFIYPLYPQYASSLLSLTNLINKNYTYSLPATDFPITLSPSIKLTATTNPLRTLGKICKNTPYAQTYEDFRILLSRYTNNRKEYGNLCLSIHPLDYLTMSDNSLNWESCMSNTQYGDYRIGTVEMMNSPTIIIAYLESSTPYTIPAINFTWNNKKWRELFIYTPDFITEVKAYPYPSEELTSLCLKYINPNPNLIPYKYKPNGNPFKFFPSTNPNGMYNDFNSSTTYQSYINPNNLPSKLYLNYSGVRSCLQCGRSLDSCDYTNLTNTVLCHDCDPNKRVQCHCCSNWFEEDYNYLVWYDDQLYCEDCYNDNFIYDELLEKDVPYEDSYQLYFISNLDDVEHYYYNPCINTSIINLNENFPDIFNIEIARKHKINEYSDIFYILPEDVKNMSLLPIIF